MKAISEFPSRSRNKKHCSPWRSRQPSALLCPNLRNLLAHLTTSTKSTLLELGAASQLHSKRKQVSMAPKHPSPRNFLRRARDYVRSTPLSPPASERLAGARSRAKRSPAPKDALAASSRRWASHVHDLFLGACRVAGGLLLVFWASTFPASAVFLVLCFS